MAKAKPSQGSQSEKSEKKADSDVVEEALVETEQVEVDPTSEVEKNVAKAGRRSAKAIKEAEAKEAKEQRKAQTSDGKTEVKPKTPQKPPRTKLERSGKKYREAAKQIDKAKLYSLNDALELATKTSPVKFDATLELHLNLNVDPKQADQNVRGTVVLPAGTGKEVRVAAADEALLAKLEKGTIDFDVLIAAPDMMPKLSKYAKLLGPKGLMPNPKSGTVTTNIDKAVKEAKAGRVEYRVDSTGIIHVGFGKVSFGKDKLLQNAQAIMASVQGNRPSSLKSSYFKSIFLTTSMGPSIQVTVSEA